MSKGLLILLLMASFAGRTQAAPIPALSELRALSNGQAFQADEKATKALVVFWATWCPDCKEKLTHTLPEMQKTANAQGLEIVTVGTDKEKERIQHFVTKEGIALPVYLDEEKKVRKELKIFSVPAWAVYRKQPDQSWKIVDTAQAYDEARVQKALQ